MNCLNYVASDFALMDMGEGGWTRLKTQGKNKIKYSYWTNPGKILNMKIIFLLYYIKSTWVFSSFSQNKNGVEKSVTTFICARSAVWIGPPPLREVTEPVKEELST